MNLTIMMFISKINTYHPITAEVDPRHALLVSIFEDGRCLDTEGIPHTDVWFLSHLPGRHQNLLWVQGKAGISAICRQRYQC